MEQAMASTAFLSPRAVNQNQNTYAANNLTQQSYGKSQRKNLLVDIVTKKNVIRNLPMIPSLKMN